MQRVFFILALAIQLTGTQLFAQGLGLSFDNLTVHGFVSQGYMNSSANNFLAKTSKGTAQFNELGINFSSEVADNLRIGLQLFARDLGPLGNDAIVIDWAYGDYRVRDWLGVRAGKMKMPLGIYNDIRDIDMLRTNILLPQGVYNESWRDTFNAIKGLGVYGSVAVPVFGTVNYQAQMGVLNLSSETGINKYIEDQLWGHFSEYDQSTTYVTNLLWETPLNGLKLGWSAFYSDLTIKGVSENSEFWRNSTVGAASQIADMMGLPLPGTYEEAQNYIDLVGIELIQEINDVKGTWISGEFVWNDLKLAAEYFNLETTLRTWNPELGDLRGESFNELGGYYGSIGYRVNDWLEAAAYYSEYYPDKSDKDGMGYANYSGFPASNGWLKDTAVSLRFDVTPFWILKLEGHAMNGTAVMYRQDQEDPMDMKSDWLLFAGKLTYTF